MKSIKLGLGILLIALLGISCNQEGPAVVNTPAINITNKKLSPDPNESGTVRAYVGDEVTAEGFNLDKVGHFDADFDYSKNAKHEKFAYIAAAGTVLYQLSANAYEHWCPLFNLEWADFLSSNGDSDMYLTMLQTKIDEGVKGFVLDPDATIFPSVLSLLEKYPDVKWMSQMAPPRDGATGDGVPVDYWKDALKIDTYRQTPDVGGFFMEHDWEYEGHKAEEQG